MGEVLAAFGKEDVFESQNLYAMLLLLCIHAPAQLFATLAHSSLLFFILCEQSDQVVEVVVQGRSFLRFIRMRVVILAARKPRRNRRKVKLAQQE